MFNYRVIFKIMSTITLFVGMSMFIPLATAIVYGETPQAHVFFAQGAVMLILSIVILHNIKYAIKYIKLRDGFLIISGIWLFLSVLGAIPFILSGYTDSFIDAFFESSAAFTTTGATVFNLDAMPRSLLMWKSVCSWYGGIGTLVLAVSLIPALGIDGKSFAQSEAPAIFTDRVSIKISVTIRNLYIVYTLFTLTEFFLLLIGPMDFYEALLNTFASVSTSGIPSEKYSASFHSIGYVQAVLIIFALLSSLNYTLYFSLLNKKLSAIIYNIELHTFLFIVCAASLLTAASLYFNNIYGFKDSLRNGLFQCVGMATTSCYTLEGFENWPSFACLILITLVLIGGCTFSTTSSIKVYRLLVFAKLIIRGLYKRIHPRSVVAVKVGKKIISSEQVSYITSYIIFFFVTILFGNVLLALQNLDFMTTISSSVAMITNSGVGFGEIASGCYAIYDRPLRLVLCFLMFAGRLDIFTFIIIFLPGFWFTDMHKKVLENSYIKQ